MKLMQFYINETDKRMLRKIAFEREISMAELIRESIKKSLEKIEKEKKAA